MRVIKVDPYAAAAHIAHIRASQHMRESTKAALEQLGIRDKPSTQGASTMSEIWDKITRQGEQATIANLLKNCESPEKAKQILHSLGWL